MKHQQKRLEEPTKAGVGKNVMRALLLFVGFGFITTTTMSGGGGGCCFVKADTLDDMVNTWLKDYHVRAASITFYDGVRIIFVCVSHSSVFVFVLYSSYGIVYKDWIQMKNFWHFFLVVLSPKLSQLLLL